MANTYSNVVLHLVFAVKFRQALIHPHFRIELQKVMTGIFRMHNQKVLAIYCMPDHVHILFDHRPNIGISDLVMRVKSGSTVWINENIPLDTKFYWQNGYGVFSCNPKNLDGIINYIHDQANHHRNQKFISEYKGILIDQQIQYQDQYLFEEIIEDGNDVNKNNPQDEKKEILNDNLKD